MPPAKRRGQVNREASRLGDAGVIDPFPVPKNRNTGGTAAVFSESIVMSRRQSAIRKNPDAAMLLAHADCRTHTVTEWDSAMFQDEREIAASAIHRRL